MQKSKNENETQNMDEKELYVQRLTHYFWFVYASISTAAVTPTIITGKAEENEEFKIN